MMKIVHMAHMNVNVIYFFSAKVDSVLMPWIGNRRAWNPSICKYENFENYGSLNGNPWYHEFENRDVWKSMSGVKFTGESYRKYCYYFDFLQILCWLGILFKFDFENEFSCVVIVEATIELSRVYEKLT